MQCNKNKILITYLHTEQDQENGCSNLTTYDQQHEKDVLKNINTYSTYIIKDFATWSGLTLTDSKKGLNLIKSMLTTTIIEGEEYFFSPTISTEKKSKEMLLLPIYDEYIMGYKNRAAILAYKNNL